MRARFSDVISTGPMGNTSVAQPIHVCVVTTAHPVDDVRVSNKFVRTFREEGFAVTWVGPEVVFFDGRAYCREDIRFLLIRPNGSRFDRLFAPYRISQLVGGLSGVNVYYAPDPDSVSVALRWARRNRAKVIFDIHEVFHGPGLNRWLMGRRVGAVSKLVQKRISHLSSKCDLVVGVSHSVLAQYGNRDSNTMVVRSCAPSWFAKDSTSNVCGVDRPRLTIMHGKGDLQRGTEKVLEAIGEASRTATGLRVIIFAGGDAANDSALSMIRCRSRELGITEAVQLCKGIPMHEMPMMLQSCDVGLIAYGRELGVDSLPNRLFEYMAAGLAIIAPAYSVEIAEIIDGEKCGLLVNAEDPSSLAEAIVKLYRNPELCREMGRRAKEAFLARHNWEMEVRPLIDTIRGWFPGRGH